MMRAVQMPRLAHPRSWPIAVKVPLLVAILMLIASAVLTDRVLRRLEATQEEHLKELTGAYLDGLSALVSPHVLRNDTWEVYDALERAATGYTSLNLLWTTVVTPSGAVIASSLPTAFPTDSPIPPAIGGRFKSSEELFLTTFEARGHLRRPLLYQGRLIGKIYAEIGIERLLQERREVLTTLILTNAALTLLLATLGYGLVRFMLRPVNVLARYLGRAEHEQAEPIPAALVPVRETELRRLFVRYNAMVAAQREREKLAAKLAEEEKLASLGRLTSGIAHEINNPLGGLFNAIDALKRHGDVAAVRVTSIRLLERGLVGIRDVVRSALHVYKGREGPRDLSVADIEDLALLIGPEVKRRRQTLKTTISVGGTWPVRAGSVRDLALNLLLNACAATPERGTVELRLDLDGEHLLLLIGDEGPGLTVAQFQYLTNAGAGSAPIEERAGLGLWMIRRSADEIGADISVVSKSTGGSEVRVALPLQRRQEFDNVA
jgi:signal transduction histidine kinase